MFASVFVCTPIRFFWDKSIIGGTCVNETAVWYVYYFEREPHHQCNIF